VSDERDEFTEQPPSDPAGTRPKVDFDRVLPDREDEDTI
jgi:hypothetical protein